MVHVMLPEGRGGFDYGARRLNSTLPRAEIDNEHSAGVRNKLHRTAQS